MTILNFQKSTPQEAESDGPVTDPKTTLKPQDEITEVPPLVSEPVAGEDGRPKFQTTTHIASYPLIRETLNLVETIPGVRVLKVTTQSLADPIVGFVFFNGLIQPIVKTIDDFGVQTLGTVDSFVPCITTVGYNEVGELIKSPFISTDQTVRAVVVSTNDAFDFNIKEPTKKLVHTARGYYNAHVYDTQGKPLLRSSVDPIFRPINRAVDEFISKNLPEGGQPVSKDFSSEVERNFWLTWDLNKRSIPVITGKINEVFMAPCTYTKHALDVFHDNLNRQEKKTVGSSIIATYNSSIDLAEEAWTKVADSTWKKAFKGKNETTAESEPVIAQAEVISEAQAKA
jgi:sporulation-specific protein 4